MIRGQLFFVAAVALLTAGCAVDGALDATDDEGNELSSEELSQEVSEITCTRGTAHDLRVRRIIRQVWGPDAREEQALRVAWCESGPWGTRARNGQYLGLFQMGSAERRRYGHGECALTQARAAHRYYVAVGHNWGPWSCKP